jgi:hypothetical protein
VIASHARVFVALGDASARRARDVFDDLRVVGDVASGNSASNGTCEDITHNYAPRRANTRARAMRMRVGVGGEAASARDSRRAGRASRKRSNTTSSTRDRR